MYLAQNVATTIGLPVSSAITQTILRWTLEGRLLGLGMNEEETAKILLRAVSDVEFVTGTTGPVHDAIVESYVDGLWWAHGEFFACHLVFTRILFLTNGACRFLFPVFLRWTGSCSLFEATKAGDDESLTGRGEVFCC